MSDIRDDLIEASKDLEASQTEDAQTTDFTDQSPTLEEGQTHQEESADIESEVSADEAKSAELGDIPEPQSWTAEMRQHWKGLPSDVRKYILDRDRQQHAYISRIGGEHGKLKKEFSEIDSVLKPFEGDLKQSGLSKGQVVERLIQERSEMVKDPVTFIKKFADAHKIDLLNISIDSDMADPPEVRKARWEYQTKEQQLEAKKARITQEQQQIQTEQLRTFVENWGSQKPHFAEVRGAMAQILPEVQTQFPYMSFQEQLEVTYNETLKHPNFASLTRPKSVPNAVKKAGSGVAGYTGTSTPQAEPSSIREALLQAAKETGVL